MVESAEPNCLGGGGGGGARGRPSCGGSAAAGGLSVSTKHGMRRSMETTSWPRALKSILNSLLFPEITQNGPL